MISVSVNGRQHQLDMDPDTPLLWAIRESIGLTGTKYGCGIAQCGACNVHLDGSPVRSCVTPVSAAAGKKVTTIEGLDPKSEHPLQRAWVTRLDKEGSVRVHRIVCAIDCGFPVNLDQIRAQMEGGAVYALTAVLYGKITLDHGRVQQSNRHDDPMLRMPEMPKVETHIIDSGEAPGGLGEPGVPPVAPSVTNAIFALTGKRIRRLPIDKELLKQA